MSFLPDWYSQGVQGQDNNGGFGTANMFNKPNAQQQGGLGYIGKLIGALRNKPEDTNMTGNPMQPSMQPPMQDNLMQNGSIQGGPVMGQPVGQPAPGGQFMNPMQQGPNMGQVNNPNTMSPNNQVMPNWNRKYGGFNGSNQ